MVCREVLQRLGIGSEASLMKIMLDLLLKHSELYSHITMHIEVTHV